MSMTEIKRDIQALPGAIGVTHLRVYESTGPDGLAGGSPHMHFACTEAYLVIKGEGAVQTLSITGFREIPLRAGSLIWFTPGVIHRLINVDGQLEIFAIMENAGLPESGDSVLTFPTSYLEDQDSYSRVASLDRDQPISVNTSEAARKRRELAVEGFRLLCAKSGNGGSLESFYHHAISLVRAKEPGWRGIWKSGAVNATRRTEAFLDHLHAGVSDYLHEGRVFEIQVDPQRGERSAGMCGTLRPYLPEGVLITSPAKRRDDRRSATN